MPASSTAMRLWVYFLTLAVVATPIIVFLAPSPGDHTNIAFTLRMSAWLAFLIYVLIFTTRPLRQLLPGSFTQALMRSRPFLGLIFAAIMTVHLAVIAWQFAFVLGKWPPLLILLVGGPAYLLMFLMLITTFKEPARALGPRNWQRLHKTGLFWIGAVFIATLTPDIVAKPTKPVYLLIGLLIVLAITARVMAFLKLRNQSTAAIDADR